MKLVDLLDTFQGVWNGDARTFQNPLFQETFGGFFIFSEEKKGFQIKIWNFVLLKFSQFYSVWEISIFYKNSKLGENTKKTKLEIPY
jgi:hypothetical protein